MPRSKPFNNLLFLLIIFVSGCSLTDDSDPVRIAINPWPGYEFMFLAQEKGFFKEQNLNIRLIEMSSLADVLRVYNQGRADGMASTMIEVVHAVGTTQKPMNIAIIADYSNGGDTIIAKSPISNIQDLKGKRVGTEIGSLGMYILALGLAKNNLNLSDIDIINVEQLDALTQLQNNNVDAVVSYPPYSTDILKDPQHKILLSTADLPGDVIDLITISEERLQSLPPDWLERFRRAWDKAIQYSQEYQYESYSIMANQEGISIEDFTEALSGLMMMNSEKSYEVQNAPSTKKNIKKVCSTLDHANSINFSCDSIEGLIITH